MKQIETAIFMLLTLICVSNSLNAQTFVPLNVSGYNHDLIANGAGGTNRAETTTTITFDNVRDIGDNVLYSKDFRGNNNTNTAPPFGLPDDRIINSLNLPGAIYQLAPYDQNNSLVLKTLSEAGTLILETPGVFSRIAFLGASAEGNSQFKLTMNFSDGSTTSLDFTVPDWFGGNNFAIKSIGRVHRTNYESHFADQFNGDAENPRLYDNQIILNPPFDSKLLVSISFEKINATGCTAIFAINGITAINAPNAPIATGANNINFNSFTANWNSVANATEYFIDVSTSPVFSTLLPGYNNLNVGNNLSVSVTGITGNQPHYYRVRAANISGTSPSSNTITVDYSECPPAGQLQLSTQAQVNQFKLNYPNCTEVNGNLYLGASDLTTDIIDLMPLDNITKVNGWIAVYYNSLSNLNGLQNITSILHDIDIRQNPNLTDISALQNTTFNPSAGFGLTIAFNPLLSVCDLPNFCNYLDNDASTHPRLITGNAADCVSEQVIKDACASGNCTITIPDPNFKSYLIGNTAINTNGDSEIQCEEAEAFSGAMLCPFNNISDLTGIESFINLSHLDCGGNQLTNLNLNSNTKLTVIAAAANQLTSLNISNCNLLQRLYCETNQLTNLNINNHPDFSVLSCHNNKLTGLNLSGLPSLKELNCNTNQLTSLNMKNGNNSAITTIVATGNPNLNCIQVDNAAFSTANWTGGNFLFDPQHTFNESCEIVPDPDGEYCSNAININALFGKALNEPQNSQTYSTEGFNSLNDPDFGQECLGANNTIWFKFTGDGLRYAVRSRDCSAAVYTDPNGAMYSGNCNSLNAIACHRDIWTGDVDPDINFRLVVQTEPGQEYFVMVEVSTTDDFEIYNEYGDFCLEVTRLDPECIVAIPDINFKNYLIENSEINTNFDDEIQCEEAESFSGWMDCSGLEISDLTGIEAFIYLNVLNCSNNNLTTLDITNNTSLTQLNCAQNNLIALNVLNNTKLWTLNCEGNDITGLDVSKILWLEELIAGENKITNLDLSGNVKVSSFLADNNNLTRLDLANGNNAFFNIINVQNNPALTCIKVDDADYSNTDWTGANFLFDDQHTFNESCNPCEDIGKEVDATFLVASNGCVGDSIHFIDYTIIDLDEDQMQFSWEFGDGNTSTQRDPVHVYSEEGDRTVSIVIDIQGCEPIRLNKSIRILNCLKKDNSPQGYSRVMPNPTTGAFRLESRLPISGDVSVSINNTEGREIYTRQFRNTNHVTDDIFFGQPGTYVAAITHSLGVDKVKIIILR